MSMYIKKIDSGMVDVFLGRGWINWVRYEYVEGRWVRTKGLRPDQGVHRKIVDKIEQFNSRK